MMNRLDVQIERSFKTTILAHDPETRVAREHGA